MRTRRVYQPSNRVSDWTIVTTRMEHTQGLERFGDRREMRRNILGHVIGVKCVPLGHLAHAGVVLEQILVAKREQRTTQGREHGQLIFRPLDRRKRRPEGVDLLAFVKRLAPNQQVRHATRFEGVNVTARDVVLKGDKASEQQAHVAGADRARRFAGSGHLPAAVVNQPAHELARRFGQ